MSVFSFLIQAVNSVRSRITRAYLAGFLLTLGPPDHLIVTTIHVCFGLLFDAPISYEEAVRTIIIATAGNLVGGIGLITFTHVAQVMGARNERDREHNLGILPRVLERSLPPILQ